MGHVCWFLKVPDKKQQMITKKGVNMQPATDDAVLL
jgi:hypothetical protein